jgi:hypothetical protein
MRKTPWAYNRRMASAKNGSSPAEQALDLRLLVDAIPALSWSSRLDGSVEFINQRWREYTGLSRTNCFGRVGKRQFIPKISLYSKNGKRPAISNQAGAKCGCGDLMVCFAGSCCSGSHSPVKLGFWSGGAGSQPTSTTENEWSGYIWQKCGHSR